MKTLLIVLIFLIVNISLFLIVSGVGVLWYSYGDIISTVEWFVIYQVGIGIWVSVMICDEIYTSWELNSKPSKF